MGAPAQVVGFFPTPGTELLGRYRIEEEIGRGGFSVVYGATDLKVGNEVAIKLLVPPPAGAQMARERMRREVQAVRGIAHPNVVALYDFLEDGMWSFIVMERIVGKNLAGIVTVGGVLPFVDVINIGKGISSALSTAHGRGILHRDVKPQNVLLTVGGVPKLVDFGAARLDGHTVTRTGALVGTLQYTAPELLAGQRGDARADVYALGLTLYYAITQRLPPGATPHSAPIASAEGHRPSEYRAHVPEWLDDVIARATVADPEARFATAAALEDALTRGGYGAAELDVARCVVCDAPEPFGLSICPACGGSADGAGDTLVFVKPEGTPEERRRIGERLEGLLQGKAFDGETGLVAGGHRALIKIPKAAADTVVRRLASRGVPSRTASARLSWARLPLPYYGLLTSTVVVGGLAGLTAAPLLAWASPLVAVLLLLAGQYQAGRPAVYDRKREPAFEPALEALVVNTFAELPRGAARGLLASVVRAAESVRRQLRQTAAPVVGAGDLEDLVREACRAAWSLSDLDENLLQYEGNAQWSGDGEEPMWMDQLVEAERMRDGLTHKLLECITLLNRLRARTLAGDDARDRLEVLVAEVERKIEAWEAVEGATTSS